jgi:hypothetical protein
MERNSVIIKKHGIRQFLSNIKFSKKAFDLYRKIISDSSNFDNYLLTFIILQASLQVGFDGYFEELYIDVCKRQDIYIKQLKENFKASFLNNESYINKCKNLFCCVKKSNRELLFNRFFSLINLDTIIAKFFVENNETNKNYFINICNQMLSENQNSSVNNKIVPVDDI